MTSQYRVVMTGEEQALFQALQKVVEQQDRTDRGFKKNEHSSTEAEKAALRAARAQAKAARDGARLADQLAKKNETLEQSYERRKKAIEEAGKAGLKSEADVKKAIDQLKETHRQEVEAVKQAEADKAESIRKSSKSYRDQQAMIQKGISKTEQLKRASKSLEEQHDDLKAAITLAYESGELSAEDYKSAVNDLDLEYENLRKSQNKSFGTEALTKIGKYVLGIASVAGAWNAVVSEINRVKEAQKNALETVDTRRDSIRDLKSISASPEQLQKRIQRSDLGSAKFGVDDKEALDLMFDAISSGFHDEFESILEADRVIDIEYQAKLGSKAKDLLKNQGKDLSVRALSNATLAATEEAAIRPNDFIENLPKTLAAGSRVNAGVGEQFAFLAQFAKGFKSTEEAATSIDQFTAAASKDQRFGNVGLVGAVDLANSLSDEERKKIFSDKGSQDFLRLANSGIGQTIREQIPDIRDAIADTGGDEDLVRQRLKFDASIPVLRNDHELAIKKQAQELRTLYQRGTDAQREAAVNAELKSLGDKDARIRGANPVLTDINRSGGLVTNPGDPGNILTRTGGGIVNYFFGPDAGRAVAGLPAETTGEEEAARLRESMDKNNQLLQRQIELMETTREHTPIGGGPGEDR